jgi:hypothetical protein
MFKPLQSNKKMIFRVIHISMQFIDELMLFANKTNSPQIIDRE